MKTPIPASKFAFIAALMGALALGGLAGGCAATPTSDSTGQYVDDTAITTKVKSALLGDVKVDRRPFLDTSVVHVASPRA